MKLKELFKKYKSLISYLFFGVCTTLVNIIVYYICAHPLNLSTTLSSALAWLLSVTFAYITNRLWVFSSTANTLAKKIKELTSFFLCRILTGLLDITIMYVFVDLLKYNDMVIKIISNVIVIIFNYIASKLVIFKKK